MKRKAKSVITILLTALMIITMLPTTAFAASSKKAPSKVSITKVTASTNAVTVKWKKASNATSYRIYYKQSGAKKWITVANVTGTSYTHKSNKKTPLVGGKKYVYTVRAYNKSSRKWGSYDTKGKTVTIPAVPSTVKMGNVKGTAYNKVSISWSKASNATMYRVYYKQSGAKKWKTVANVSGTSYTHTSSKKAPLVSGKKYVYTVRAYNKSSKKWGKYNTKGVSVTVPKKNSKPTTVPVTKISFSPSILELKLNVGATYQLNPILAPSNTTQKDLIWSSDHPEVISVDKNGKITILRDNADVVITARSASNSKISGSCEIKSWSGKPVETIKVSSLVFNPSSISMKVGETKSVSVTVLPENAVDKYFTWESADTSIADVYEMSTGKANIVANKAGTTTIIAHAEDGSNVVGKCTVTVSENIPEATATPTPANVPVNSISISPSSVNMTEKGQTYSLSATVLPSNATNNSISWSSSNENVATVNSMGTVTAIANGNTTIKATALDGSGVSGSCNVTVNIPSNAGIETVNLAGGETKILSVWNEDYAEDIDVSNITFECSNNNDVFSIGGKTISAGLWSRINIRAQKQGSVAVLAKYNGQTLKRWNITVTSNWSEYMGYVSWRKNVESQIWNDNMSVSQKLDAAKGYIKANFAYKLGSNAAVYAYKGNVADCITASEFMGDFAKDIGCTVRYYNQNTGKHYEYIVKAYSASGGHIFCHILLNDQWVIYDASNLS